MAEVKSVSSTEDFCLLILGEDEASGLCDVVMLASVRNGGESVGLMQIPRDTYLKYTEKNYKKINGAVATLGGAQALCRLLESTLALEIDGYVKVDLSFVKRAVDVLGGVEIDVPCDMDYDDPAQGLSIHLKKGRQRLTGEQAAQFIRFRSGYKRADLTRIDAQKLFLAALLNAAKKVDGKDIPRLASTVMMSAETDVSIATIISWLRLAPSLDMGGVTFVTAPGEEVKSEYSGAWYYVLSRSGVAEVLETQFGVFGASAAIDPAHLFSDVRRPVFEEVYRRHISPEYYSADMLSQEGIAADKR